MGDHFQIEAQLHGRGEQLLGKYLPEFVYGGMDGCVTTFAVVAGAAGAGLDTSVVLILGFANLIADGFSMSVGNYLAANAERDRYYRHQRVERWEVDNMPSGEKLEVRQIYEQKGLSGPLLDEVVDIITSNKERWVNEMMQGELGMSPPDKLPVRTAAMTFLAFNLVGLIPLLAYVANALFGLERSWLFPASSVMAAIGFATIGFLKGLVTEGKRMRSLIETVTLGLVAATLAYVAGTILEKILS